jgi:glycosyltransferase involved in cell wall biosynthesis
MRIGIDAKWFFSGNPSGKVVVQNLLEELLKISGHHQVFIFLKKEEKNIVFPLNYPNISLVYVWGKNNQISNLYFVRKTAKKLKLDIILCFYFSPIFIKIKRIVFVFDAIYISNPEYFTLIERIYFSTIKFLASKADMVLTISKTEKARLLKHRFNSENKIDFIYMGVQTRYKPLEHQPKEEITRIQSKFNLPERFILYVGRINPRKNILNLLSAISFIKDNEIKLVLAGQYDGKSNNLHDMIIKLGLEGKVDLLGYVDDNDLPILYSLATVFCYVSHDEGFGLPPLEALASGIPVVIANTGSLPEVCGDAGSYCDPDNPGDIAKKIDSLLSDSFLYDYKKNRGIEIAKNYDWTDSALHLMKIIDKVGGSSI